MITFTIPLKTSNPLNGSQGRSRAAMFGKAARRKKERHTAFLCACAGIGLKPHGRTVTLTRLSAGKLDSHDGLRAALKGIVDGLADALGVNDGGPDVTWIYDQRKVKRGVFGVEVTIG